MKQTKDLKELEGKIGYTFKDKTLFKQALTHSSYANEHRHEGLKDNERLEFLGDAVLEIISSEYLFYNYPDMAEGEMTALYVNQRWHCVRTRSASEAIFSLAREKSGQAEETGILSYLMLWRV